MVQIKVGPVGNVEEKADSGLIKTFECRVEESIYQELVILLKRTLMRLDSMEDIFKNKSLVNAHNFFAIPNDDFVFPEDKGLDRLTSVAQINATTPDVIRGYLDFYELDVW